MAAAESYRRIMPLRRTLDLPLAFGLSATRGFSEISDLISLLIVYLKEG